MHYLRKAPDTGLVGPAWERCVVGGALGVTQVRYRALHQCTDLQVRILGHVVPPAVETFAGRLSMADGRIHDDKAREALRHLHRQRQTQKSPPVLTNQADVVQIGALYECYQRVPVKMKRVPIVVNGLVRTPETEHVGHYRASARGQERRQHASEQVGPGRLTVQAQEYRSVAALVDVMHP